MIRNKTLLAAARVLLGAFIAAYAMSSVHVYARVAAAGDTAPRHASAGHGAAHDAAHETAPDAAPKSATASTGAVPGAPLEMESHCQPKAVDAAMLLCKFHCQNAVQTLDHPGAALADLPPAAALTVPLADLTIPRKPLATKALRPEAAHHGGAPPPYASTARLRI